MAEGVGGYTIPEDTGDGRTLADYSPDNVGGYSATTVDVSPDEYLRRQRQAGLALRRGFDEQEKILRERGFSDSAVKSQMRQFKLDRVKQEYEGTVPGGTMEQFARNTVPFLDFADVRNDKGYAEARKKFEAGDDSPQVIDTIARYERLQEIDQNPSFAAQGLKAAAGLPKIFGEAWVAGRAVKTLAGAGSAALPGALGRASAAVAEGTSLSSHASRMAAMLPLTPSMYLAEARQRNIEANRDPDDPRGFPGPMLYGYANLLVLNSLSGNIQGATTASRMAKAGGLGMLEQQGVDAAGGLWDEFAPEAWQTKTRYGLLGNLARGEAGEAAKHAAIQFMTFAAFRGVHEFQAKADAAAAKEAMREELKSRVKTLEEEARKGTSAHIAMRKAEADAAEEARREFVRDATETETRRRAASERTSSAGSAAERIRRTNEANRLAEEEINRRLGSRSGTDVEATPESPTITPDGRPPETGKTPGEPPIVDPGATGKAKSKPKHVVREGYALEQGRISYKLAKSRGASDNEANLLAERAYDDALNEPVEGPDEGRDPTFGDESQGTPATSPDVPQPKLTRTLRDAAGKTAAPGPVVLSQDPQVNIGRLNRLMDEKGLTAQEKEVLLARGDRNLQIQIARRMGLSRERIRQVEAAARKKLGIRQSLDELGFSPSKQAATEASFRRQSDRGDVEATVDETGKAEVAGADPKREGMEKKINDRLDKITEELGKTTDQAKIDKLSKEYEKLSGDLEWIGSRRMRPMPSEKVGKLVTGADPGAVSPETQARYRNALKDAFSALPDSVRKIAEANTREVKFYTDAESLTDAVTMAELANPRTSKERMDELETLAIQGKLSYGAAYYDGVLYLDGEVLTKTNFQGWFGHGSDTLDLNHVFTHEIGHSLDGPELAKSHSPAWRAIHNTEFATLKDGKHPLTRYASTHVAESFAEFARLLYATDVSTAQIRAAFPEASRFFADRGWFPPERGAPNRGRFDAAIKLIEAFERRIEVNPETGEHVDIGRVPDREPGAAGARGEVPQGTREHENVRNMLESVQREPLEDVNRLVLADAVQEAGFEKNAEAVRREIDQPPGQTGVSHWRQLHPDQIESAMTSTRYKEIEAEVRSEMISEGDDLRTDFADRRLQNQSLDRYFAEKEARGERLEFKTPENPVETYGEGTYPFPQFGPKVYADWGPREVDALFRTLDSDPQNPWSGHVATKDRAEAGSVIEFHTDSMRDVYGSLGPDMVHQGRGSPDDMTVQLGDYYGGMREPPRAKQLQDAALSVTVRARTLAGTPTSDTVRLMRTMRDLVEGRGWRRVKMPNGDVRFDSPLRQRLRGEQALGVRTGEARFLPSGKLSDLAEKAIGKDRVNSVKKFFQNIFTAPGQMPREGFEELLARDSKMRAHAFDVSKGAADLEKATGGNWGKVPDALRAQIQQALTTPDGWKTLPSELQTPARNMRDKIDAMTDALKKAGAIPDTLIPTVDANLGVYLTRTFEALTDRANYHKKLKTPEGEAVVNRFKSWFTEEAARHGRTVTPEEVNAVVLELIRGDTAADNMLDFFRSSRLGTKDVGILTARKELAPELLELLGEVKDPIANFAMTVGRQAKLLENHVFQTRLRDIGLKSGFFSQTRSDAHPFRVSAEGSKGMDVLSDVYAPEEVAKAFQQAYIQNENPGWLKSYMKVLGLAKYSKTVLSPVAHIRQLLGNVLLVTRQGYALNADANRHIRSMWNDSEAGRDYHRKLVELGLDDSVRLGELRDVFKDAMDAKDIWELPHGITDKGIKRAVKKGFGLTEKSYRGEDLVMKVQAFENEKARYREAHPEWSAEQVETEAARIVHATFPTYSRVPGGIRWLRRFPLVGSFVSFSSEIVRTTYNTGAQIRKELSSDNKAERAIGAKRLGGMIATLSSVALLSMVSRLAANVTLSEEDAIRRNMPEWSRDGQLLHLGKDKNGNYRVVDLGRTDPHSFLLEPFQAGLTGSRSGTFTPGAVARPIVSPFLGEEIGTRVALDIARNRTETGGQGGQVYNPEDSALGKAQSIASHTWLGFEPGFWAQGKRTLRAASGVRNPTTGKEYSVADELAADAFGQRVIEVSPKDSLTYKARTYTGRMAESAREMNRAADTLRRTGRPVTAEAIAGPRLHSEEMRRGVFGDMLDDVRAARMMGMTDSEIAEALRAGGVSREDLGAILGGQYREKPLRDVLRR